MRLTPKLACTARQLYTAEGRPRSEPFQCPSPSLRCRNDRERSSDGAHPAARATVGGGGQGLHELMWPQLQRTCIAVFRRL